MTLTPKQSEVLLWVQRGLSNKQIAKNMGIAESTVKLHITSIFEKHNVRNRTQLAVTSIGQQSNAQQPPNNKREIMKVNEKAALENLVRVCEESLSLIRQLIEAQDSAYTAGYEAGLTAREEIKEIIHQDTQ